MVACELALARDAEEAAELAAVGCGFEDDFGAGVQPGQLPSRPVFPQLTVDLAVCAAGALAAARFQDPTHPPLCSRFPVW